MKPLFTLLLLSCYFNSFGQFDFNFPTSLTVDKSSSDYTIDLENYLQFTGNLDNQSCVMTGRSCRDLLTGVSLTVNSVTVNNPQSYTQVSGNNVIISSSNSNDYPSSVTLSLTINYNVDYAIRDMQCPTSLCCAGNTCPSSVNCGCRDAGTSPRSTGTLSRTHTLTLNFRPSQAVSADDIIIGPNTAGYCGSGPMSLTIDPAVYRVQSAYRLYTRAEKTGSVFFFNNGTLTLDQGDLSNYANDGNYTFYVTEQEPLAQEQGQPARKTVSTITLPRPVVNGETNVCVGDYSQRYTVTNSGSFNSVALSCTGCSSATQTGNRIDVTWSGASGTKRIVAHGTKDGCSSPVKYYNVTVRNDVTVYNVSGTTSICDSETSTVTLSGSRSGASYVLFRNGSEQAGQAKTGTGGALTWSGLGGTFTYTVKQRLPGCGDYNMNGNAVITEYNVPAPPTISGVDEYCHGQNVNLFANTSNSTRWEWQKFNGSWTVIPGEDTNNLRAALASDVTKVRARYYDGNSCPSAFREYAMEIVAPPSGYSINGLDDVCINDYTQEYSAVGDADVWEWDAVNGSINGSGDRVTIEWDPTKSTHAVTLRGSNSSPGNVVTCEGSIVSYPVVLRTDVVFYGVSADAVCEGENGVIHVAGSQDSYTYFLFNAANQQVGEGRVGSNSALSWDNIAPGTYQVRILYPGCGPYVIGSTEIVERAASPPPIIFGNPSRCGDGLYELQAGTSNVSDEFIFYERRGTGYTELGRANARNGQSGFEVNATSDLNTFGVSYIDQNGCESLIRDVVVDLLDIPVIEIVSNPTICSYESGVPIHDFILQGRNGTASGDIIANNRIFPSLVDEYDRTYTVEYLLPSPNGCSNSTSFELPITSLPTVDLLSDRVEQCIDRGTYDLRNNIFTDNGHNLIFSIDREAIVGSLINLAGYDLGEHEITIAIEGENTCENEQSFILEITSVNEIIIPPSELTYCPGFTEISLSAIFSGYTGLIKVNGTTISSGVLLQASGVWNIGDNVLSFTEDQACEFEQVYNLYIEPVPVLDIGSDLFVCEEDGEINLMFSDRQGTVPVTPPGGEWTGRFENRNLFNASSAVNGTYEMTYTVEINGCTHSASKNVIVNQTPNVFVGGDFSLCRNSEGFPLRSLPNVPGGVWEGSLAIGEQDIYYPGLEEGSTNVVTLTYTFTDNNQCSGSDQVRISLTDVPTITASVPSYSFCVNDDPYNVLQDIREADVTVTSQDGGVSGGRILPDIMGVGTHEILVQREVNGCFNTITLPVDIRGADNIVFPEQSICVNAPTLNLLTYLPGGSPTNGQFVGKGVFEGNKIVPPEVGSGTEFYTYSVQNDSECNIKGTLRLVIHPIPVQPEVDQVYYSCAEGDQFEISVNNVNESQQYTWYTGDNEVIGQGPTLGIDDHVSLNGYVVATSDQGCAIRSGDFEVLSSDLSGSGRSLPENEVKTGEWIQFFNDIEAARYEWKFSNGIESTDKNPILVFNDVNEWVSADLTVISEFGCTRTYTGIDSVYVNDDSNEYVITNPSRENDGLVLKQNDTKFRLYPTPSTNQRVTLSFQSIQDEKVEIKIYDMMNKSLVDGVFYDVVTGDNDLSIDISKLPEGMFVMSVLGSQWKKMNFLVGVKSSR